MSLGEIGRKELYDAARKMRLLWLVADWCDHLQFAWKKLTHLHHLPTTL